MIGRDDSSDVETPIMTSLQQNSQLQLPQNGSNLTLRQDDGQSSDRIEEIVLN